MKCLATFHITSMAILFERTLRKEGLTVKVVPVPRQLSASCGLACEFPCDATERVKAVCAERKIETAGFHTLDDQQ
jgi:hypothetical protein